MLNTKRAALGKTVLGNSQTLLVLLPREDGILAETLLYQNEIKEMETSYEKPGVTEAELALAEQLVRGMEEPFEPEKYHDEFQEKLRSLIGAKIAGKETVVPKEERPDAVLDLMEALKASVKHTKTAHAAKPHPRAPRKRKEAQ